MKEKIGLIGGDLRQKYLLDSLNRTTICFGNDSIIEKGNSLKSSSLSDLLMECNVLLVPVPFSKDQHSIYARYFMEEIPIHLLIDEISSKHLLIGGPFSAVLKKSISSKGARFIDITCLETFKMQNAIPTVEGVISELIHKRDQTIHGSKALIIGYGYCGERMAKILLGMGAKVDIYSENAFEKSKCKINGLNCIDQLCPVNQFDFIINTIPKVIISLEDIEHSRLLIDITESYSAETDNFVQMRGIPGRFSPKTAGRIMGELINDVINNVTGEDG